MRKWIQLSNKIVCNEETSILVFFSQSSEMSQGIQVITFLTGVLQLRTCASNCEVGILAVSCGRPQDMWNPPSCCCSWHIHFPEQSTGTIFASTSMAHQITLVTVTDQITPALQPCQKGGNAERGKASLAKARRKGWERQAEVEKRKRVLFHHKVSCLCVPATSWRRGRRKYSLSYNK